MFYMTILHQPPTQFVTLIAINFFIKPIIDAHRRKKKPESVTGKAKYNGQIAPTKIRYM